MTDSILIHLPTGGDVKVPSRVANRCNGKELVDLCWEAIPGLRSSDKQYWSVRTCHTRDDDTVPTWLSPDRKLSDHPTKSKEFIFLPRVYPEAWHELSNAFAIELLFLSVKKSIYLNELRFTDATKDALAGCALQAIIGNYKSDNESRSALRRYYLVPLTKDLEYWAESERRALLAHKKQHGISRGKAITNYLMIATNQTTYGVEIFKGLSDKNKRSWVVGVCYSGLHRYHPGQLEQPEKIFDWKKLENLFYRDKKFSVEICQDPGEDGNGSRVSTRGTYSWYGRGVTIKALWNAAIHAHQFYLDQKSQRKTKSAKFQKQIDELERKLDRNNLINIEVPDIPLEGQQGARLMPSKKPEESPERRARELEAMIALKEKRKQLEDQYYQRVEQLKTVLRQEAKCTNIIPPEYKKYHTVEDEEWDRELKQAKSFHQTTFKLTNLSISESTTETNKKIENQIQVSCKSPAKKSDHALDELRRVEKDLEVNLKITETLSKLNSANREDSNGSKRSYVRRQQELLYRKYLKKLQSLEETKASLEKVVKSSGYFDNVVLNNHKDRTSILLEDLTELRTSGSGSSISLNIENHDCHHQVNRSGTATPNSARSATSLHEDDAQVTAGLTRQYSFRRESSPGQPNLTGSSQIRPPNHPNRPPSPATVSNNGSITDSTTTDGSSITTPTKSDNRPPPVSERTTSLTPQMARRVSQPLLDIPSDNITLRPRPSTKQDQPGKPIKIDYSNTISWNSTAEIESKYCYKHRSLRSQSSLGDNSNQNNHHGTMSISDLENASDYYHPGYGLMPRQPNPHDFDTLSEVSFASDNINFQSKGHIRQLLQDHFKHKKKVTSSQTLQSPQNYTRIPRSRSNTSSTFATSSRDSALGTEVDSDGRTVTKSAPSTPGTRKRQVPSSLSLNPHQTDLDLGTPTSCTSSTGITSAMNQTRVDPSIPSQQLVTSSSLHSLGFSIPEVGTEAAKRREVLPESSTHHTSSTGLRRALRSRVSNDVGGGYLKDVRMNDSYKFATLPRNFRRSISQRDTEQAQSDQNTNTLASQRSTINTRFIDSMTLPGRRTILNDSYEASSANTSLVSRKSVGSDSEVIADRPNKAVKSKSSLTSRPNPPYNTPTLARKHSLIQNTYRPAITPRQNAAKVTAARVIELKYNSKYATNNQRRIDIHSYDNYTSDSDTSTEML